ncbi:class I SAM-dependent methyltransferase [Mucilaginibacter jinjuensis]|uniref:Class I SAM-dependent methyltransferase n=1 Tax=Mucilaginibacter jinjuensis TaxID=1176721 RepID=A0ABY7TE24_9SPHI|nr:class I SAM-dependent methyltransferase [Mucilaginibacter jinjuensis]WCT14775.1 class I SAM-dependent methyltransferase [Mucilaginibacter jinjuensis]
MSNPTDNRDYSTISPSAKALLYLKGLTSIPFAKAAAEQMMLPDKYEPDFSLRDFGFWTRVVHFESRYWSLDYLLASTGAKNVLELSSGFSFRGLAAVADRADLHYIDTDLPEVIATKKQLLEAIKPELKGTLDVLPLNALDEEAFRKTVDRFPAGEVAIVNEGLLMYLGLTEKEKLCRIIHRILSERGGYWITADIYIKRANRDRLMMNDQLNEFFKQHNIDEQMFESFEEAEEFFNKNGFVVDKEAVPDRDKLTSLTYMLQSATEEQLNDLRSRKRIQTSWRLKIAP